MTSKSNAPPEIERNGEAWFQGVSQPLWVRHLLPLVPFNYYLELGCFAGDSFFWALDNLLADDGCAVGVDPWIPSRRWENQVEWMQTARDLCHTRLDEWSQDATRRKKKLVQLRECKSEEYLLEACHKGYPQFDLIYVDACHLAVEAMTDLVLSWRLLKPGGILVCDDLNLVRGKRLSRGALVGEAWPCFLTCFGHKCSILYDSPAQSAIVKLPFNE